MSDKDAIRVALVTGAARRVGRVIALQLARAGYDIALTYLNSQSDAQSLADEIRSFGRRALSIRADLADPDAAIHTIAEQFHRDFSQLNVLVNNASLYVPSSLQDTDLDQMRQFWAIHVESPTLLARHFAEMLRESCGAIVNMVDTLAERSAVKYLAYSASKAGLWNLTLGLARELAPEVRVNGIAPGAVEWSEEMPESERQQYLKRVPLGRVGTPEEVADAVLFLSRATYITGQIIRLDGGRSIT